MEVKQRNKKTKKKQNVSKLSSSSSVIKHKEINHSLLTSFINWIWLEEDASFLGIFRIFWGLIMTSESWGFIKHNFMRTRSHYYMSRYGFHSKYFPFYFVELMSFDSMQIFLYFLLLSGIFITIGFKYKISCIYFFLGISYLFLLDSIHHLNHMYLVCVISFIMIFIPCNCVYSIDNRKSSKTATVPKIYLFFIRTFFIIVYTYAGIVKINEDWLRAEPLRHWIGYKQTIFGDYLNYEISAYIMSYGGLFYDLFVGLLLLWNPTFWIGVLATMFFHLCNKFVFNIGIFPYVMIASTTLFFKPDYPRKLFHQLFNRNEIYKPLADTAVTFKSFKLKKKRKFSLKQKLIMVAMLLFIIWWILMPMRYHFLPGQGPQMWTENSHMFSWRMKLRDRDCVADFFGVYPDTKEVFKVPSYPEHEMVAKKQRRKIPDRPQLTIQYAHFLADLYSINGTNPEIYCYSECSVNYRPFEKYVNRSIDLGRASLWEIPNWILPISPLDEKYYPQYPWNWTFDDEWWNRMFSNNKNKLITEISNRKAEMEILKDNHSKDFIQYIADRFYNSDKTKVSLELKIPDKSKRGRRR